MPPYKPYPWTLAGRPSVSQAICVATLTLGLAALFLVFLGARIELLPTRYQPAIEIEAQPVPPRPSTLAEDLGFSGSGVITDGSYDAIERGFDFLDAFVRLRHGK